MTYKTYRVVHWDTTHDSNGDNIIDESIPPLTMGGVTWTMANGTLTGAVVEDKNLEALLSKLENLNPVVDSE